MPRKYVKVADRAKAESAKVPKAPVDVALSRGFEERQEVIAKPERTGDTVTVACKMPNGLVLQIQKEHEVRYPVMGGGFTIEKQWRPDHECPSFTLNGNRVPHGEQPRCLVIGGYAMTPGIPADFMAKWMEQNRNLELVKANLIRVHRTIDHARGDATEKKDIRCGLEPINPPENGGDIRLEKRRDRRGKLVDAIETGQAA